MKPPTPELLARRAAFGLNVRTARERNGMSQEELAHRAGVDRSYAGAIERGERNLSIDNMWRFADALGQDLRDLL